ncbi:hypothetical protein H4R35_005680 [Dimargaris xerosporica]|nr:hypothetical protein H4R35_005680 [Dimargaris xerosporica]
MPFFSKAMLAVLLASAVQANPVVIIPGNTELKPSLSVIDPGTSAMVQAFFSAFRSQAPANDSQVPIDICPSTSRSYKTLVAKSFAEKLMQYGSGQYSARNGNTSPVWLTVMSSATNDQPYGCYVVWDTAKGQSGNSLIPFSSAVSADFQPGDTVYVEKLDGVKMNAHQSHNGCLRIEGTGTAKGQIAVYAYSEKSAEYFKSITASGPQSIQKQACDPLTYYYSEDPSKNLGGVQ